MVPLLKNMKNNLPRDYRVLLDRFEELARLTDQLYSDIRYTSVEDDDVRDIAEVSESVIRHYCRVYQEEIYRQSDECDVPEPLIIDEEIEGAPFTQLMSIMKRKQGVFEQISRDGGSRNLRTISLQIHSFLNIEVDSFEDDDPVLYWMEENSSVELDNVHGMYLSDTEVSNSSVT